MSPSASQLRKAPLHKAMGLVLTLVCVAAPTLSQAAPPNPVHWTFSSRKINAATYELHMTAKLDAGWHIYSQQASGDGPVPTSFKFASNPSIVQMGQVKEAGRLIKIDPGFGYKAPAYQNTVDFVATVSKRGAGPAVAKGSVEFMAATTQQTLPPMDLPFAIDLN